MEVKFKIFSSPELDWQNLVVVGVVRFFIEKTLTNANSQSSQTLYMQ